MILTLGVLCVYLRVVGNVIKSIVYHFLKYFYVKLLWCKFVFLKNIWLSLYRNYDCQI